MNRFDLKREAVLVIRDGDRIVLTSAGLALSRVVASVFDAWLARSEARHSVAV